MCHGDRYPMGSQDLAARSLTLDQSDRHTECLGHKVENGVVCPALRCRCCDLDAKNVTVCSPSSLRLAPATTSTPTSMSVPADLTMLTSEQYARGTALPSPLR